MLSEIDALHEEFEKTIADFKKKIGLENLFGQ